MNNSQFTDRRTILKTVGAGVIAGTVLTGRAVASTEGVTSETDIELEGDSSGHHFEPHEWDTSPGEKVRWEHDDQTSAGLVHNVHIEESPNGGTQLMSSGALEEGDWYEVTFSLEDNDDTLRLKDDNQSKTIDVSNEGTSVELGVVCDFHAGQIEGGMNMDRFTVNL